MSQAPLSPQIQERMEVVDPSGQHVGVVDHIEGDYIKLTKQHPNDSRHHYIPMQYVAGVSDRVHLNRPIDDLTQHWGKDH